MPLPSFRLLAAAFALAILAGCATPPPAAAPTIAVPMQTAWFEGKVVHYVTTDVSDADVARAKGVNFVPRLKELLPNAPSESRRAGSPLERVYAFVNTAQPTVFPSIPRPVGPDSKDLGYTPLWRMVQVAWQPGRSVVELKSEEDILAAEDRGDVRLRVTDIVLNCPVLWVQGDPPMRGVRLRP